MDLLPDGVLPLLALVLAITGFFTPALKVAMGLFIILATWLPLPALSRGGPLLVAAGGAGTAFLSMFFGASGPLAAAFFAKAFDDRRVLSARTQRRWRFSMD